MVIQERQDGNMDDDEANKAHRAAILRKAIERLEEVLPYTEGERREAILKLITKAERALAELASARLDKRQLH